MKSAAGQAGHRVELTQAEKLGPSSWSSSSSSVMWTCMTSTCSKSASRSSWVRSFVPVLLKEFLEVAGQAEIKQARRKKKKKKKKKNSQLVDQLLDLGLDESGLL